MNAHWFKPGDRVYLARRVPPPFIGRVGTVGLVYADGDVEVHLDGDEYPTICGPEQMEHADGGGTPPRHGV